MLQHYSNRKPKNKQYMRKIEKIDWKFTIAITLVVTLLVYFFGKDYTVTSTYLPPKTQQK